VTEVQTVAHVVSSYAEAMDALKAPALRQALYDAGARVMRDALITLHGDAHRQRRIVEMGVFGRGFFRTYAREVFAPNLEQVLAPYLAAGRADVIELGYRLSMNLTADFAGIDRPANDVEETESLLALVRKFSEGATLVHSTRDHADVNGEVDAAMTLFDQRFFMPSIERRRRLIDEAETAGTESRTLPRDVLTTLLKARDRMDLSMEVLRREMSFFLQAGAHSTTNSSAHALHEILTWAGDDADRRARLEDVDFVQRCVHESLRLHPASPVAWRRAIEKTRLGDQALSTDELVEINLAGANRDVTIFGPDASTFNPDRQIPNGVWPWGLTFGYGMHACLGRDLDGGVISSRSTTPEDPQLGIVPTLVHELLKAGALWCTDDPPVADITTLRSNWGRYPIQFTNITSRRT
jgi:cytochrome P450